MLKNYMIIGLLISRVIFASEPNGKFDIEQELKNFNKEDVYRNIGCDSTSSLYREQMRVERIERCHNLAQVWNKAIEGLDKNNYSKVNQSLGVSLESTKDYDHLGECSEFLKKRHSHQFDSVKLEMREEHYDRKEHLSIGVQLELRRYTFYGRFAGLIGSDFYNHGK